MTQTIADSSLGLNAQALAVLAILAQHEPDFAEWDEPYDEYVVTTKTAAWYNGRERGFSLVVRRDPGDRVCLVVTVAEGRSCGSIFIGTWQCEERFLNPPTVEDRPEDATLHEIDCERVDLAVNCITKLMKDFLDARKAAQEAESQARTAELLVRKS